MSASNTGEVNTNMTGEEIHSLDDHKVEDVNSAAATTGVPNTSEEVARQIKAATDPLTKQLGRRCDLMVEIRRDTSRRNEGAYAPNQGPSGSRCEKYDAKQCFYSVKTISTKKNPISRWFWKCSNPYPCFSGTRQFYQTKSIGIWATKYSLRLRYYRFGLCLVDRNYSSIQQNETCHCW